MVLIVDGLIPSISIWYTEFDNGIRSSCRQMSNLDILAIFQIKYMTTRKCHSYGSTILICVGSTILMIANIGVVIMSFIRFLQINTESKLLVGVYRTCHIFFDLYSILEPATTDLCLTG